MQKVTFDFTEKKSILITKVMCIVLFLYDSFHYLVFIDYG